MTEEERIGLAAMLPGLLRARLALEREIADIQGRMAEPLGQGAEFAGMPLTAEEKKLRPKTNREGMNAYWAKFTPEERTIEMKRRWKLAMKKRIAAAREIEDAEPRHPRDKRHPGHAAWLKKIKKAQKAAWKRLTAAEHNTKVAKLLEGRINGESVQ